MTIWQWLARQPELGGGNTTVQQEQARIYPTEPDTVPRGMFAVVEAPFESVRSAYFNAGSDTEMPYTVNIYQPISNTTASWNDAVTIQNFANRVAACWPEIDTGHTPGAQFAFRYDGNSGTPVYDSQTRSLFVQVRFVGSNRRP